MDRVDTPENCHSADAEFSSNDERNQTINMSQNVRASIISQSMNISYIRNDKRGGGQGNETERVLSKQDCDQNPFYTTINLQKQSTVKEASKPQ